jgi:diguanylate cyclase (GGDEF)-like protein
MQPIVPNALPPPRMSLRSRSARRWLRLRRRVLRSGQARMTIAAALIAALLAAVASQAALRLTGAPWDLRIALVAMLGVGALVAAVVWPLMRMLHDLEAARVQLDVLATRDELTGVYNRRQFLVLADREWARCRRYDMGAALLMLDVDHFKRVNDLHGHLAGDLMLREIARAIGDTLRHADFVGRFGGEEFIVFLAHADTLGALDVAERIRERVAAIALDWRGERVSTTMSVGVGTLGSEHDSIGALIADADRALYTAKHAGRNCVRTPAAVDAADVPSSIALPWSGFGSDAR